MRVLTFIIFLFPAIAIAGNTFFYAPQDNGDTTSLSFIEVRELEKLSRFELFTQTSNYFNTQKDLESIVYSDSLDWIQIKSKTTIRTAIVGKAGHPEGIIDYSMKVEFKDGKYRCIFDKMFYTPMKRNRYGIFSALTSKKKPINTSNFKVGKSTWKKIFKHMTSFSYDYTEKLNEFLNRATNKSENKGSSDW